MKHAPMIAVLLLSSAGVSAAQGVHIGAGAHSCGQWVEARHGKTAADTIRSTTITAWIEGYLFGIDEATRDEQSLEDLARLVADGKMTLSDEDLLPFYRKKFGTASGLVFEIPDSDALRIWVDNYCSAHPFELVLKAARALADELESSSPTGKKSAAAAAK